MVSLRAFLGRACFSTTAPSDPEAQRQHASLAECRMPTTISQSIPPSKLCPGHNGSHSIHIPPSLPVVNYYSSVPSPKPGYRCPPTSPPGGGSDSARPFSVNDLGRILYAVGIAVAVIGALTVAIYYTPIIRL